MNVAAIHEGLWVRIIELGKTNPIADPTHLANRRPGEIGRVKRRMISLPNGWWVQHEHGMAPYRYFEMEALDPQPPNLDDWGGSPIF